jgi:AcrR family transcriptional regulator
MVMALDISGDDSTQAERAFTILIVRSTSNRRQEDLTTKARIRDAALARFPRDGFGGTTIRAVAADAGVSPALVVHHFGSKDGLREACDQHVVSTFRETKLAAMEDDNMFNPAFAASAYQLAAPLLRYFGWALARGHPAADDLFDEMLKEGIEISRVAIESGMIHGSPDLRTRTAVQMSMQLGMTVMHAHLKRNLGVDLLTAEGIATLTPTMLEIFSGLFTPSVLHQIEDTYGDRARELLDSARAHIES